MSERDIPKGEWEAFCESFGMEHKGWVVSVEKHGTNGVPDEMEHNMVLDSIVVVPGDDDKSGIFITVSREADGRHVHQVPRPSAVRLEQAGGVHDALTIESDDGALTEIHLRPGALPDRFDVFTTE